MSTSEAAALSDWAVATAHRLEISLLQARVDGLAARLREHGVTVPAEDQLLGASGVEHLEQCKRVVLAAYGLLREVEELRRLVGSGVELLEESWR